MWNPHIIRDDFLPDHSNDIVVTEKDKAILKGLAEKNRTYSELPIMRERKRLWTRHNDLKSERPMILADCEGAWQEMIPTEDLQCTDPVLREWELRLRKGIFNFEDIGDDDVIEPWFEIPWDVKIGDYGVTVEKVYGENRGSYSWKHPINNLDEDLEKLKFRKLSVNREATNRDIDIANQIFGDILPARIGGKYWWSAGMTADIIHLVGMEDFMIYMFDNPSGVHRLMKWFSDEFDHFMNWFVDEGLLNPTYNNEYVGSGGIAYTKDLPVSRLGVDGKSTLKNIWGHSESQETVGISPEMFSEFIFPYQKPLIEQYGLACYGCCEGVEDRLPYIMELNNLRRVSISPWANEERCAEILSDKYVYSRKPNPAPVSIGFDEAAIAESLEYTLNTAKGCNLEFNMKDTHTLENDKTRMKRWVEITRNKIDDIWE